METTNSKKGQLTKYFYWFLAIVAFITIVAGISGAFVPEERVDSAEATESAINQVTNHGQESVPSGYFS